MAILMRRGLLEDFDPSKLRAGEWAVSIDAATERQLVYMCFAPGVVKRMGTYDDFMAMIREISSGIADEIAEEVEKELQPVRDDVHNTAGAVEGYKNEVIAIDQSIINVYTPQILEWYNNTEKYKNEAAQSALDADASAKASEKEKEDSAEFAQLSSDAADLSDGFAKLSESYAHGNGSREGDATDNSKYYSEQSKASSETAKTYLDSVESKADEVVQKIEDAFKADSPEFHVDLTDGHLYYEGGRFVFNVNHDNGHLEWGLGI